MQLIHNYCTTQHTKKELTLPELTLGVYTLCHMNTFFSSGEGFCIIHSFAELLIAEGGPIGF